METHSPDKIGDIAKKFAIRIVGEKLEVNEFGEKIYSFNPHLNDFMHCVLLGSIYAYVTSKENLTTGFAICINILNGCRT